MVVICRVVRKQLAYMAGRQQLTIELPDEMLDKNDLQIIMTNSHINDHFHSLARELDVMEPKTPEEVCNSNSLFDSQTLYWHSSI